MRPLVSILCLIATAIGCFCAVPATAQDNPFGTVNFNTVERARNVYEIFDDFNQYVTGDLWTLVTDVDGTATITDAAGGRIAIAAAVASVGDNEMTILKSNKETFLFAANKPIYFEARVQFTEANTDDANIIIGLINAADASKLQNDGAGPPADYSGVVFFKVDGGTVWNCESSVSTTQVTDATETTAGGDSFQRLAYLWKPTSSTEASVTYWIDGTEVASQTMTYTGGTEMQIILGVLTGGTNAETLTVDYVYAGQTR